MCCPCCEEYYCELCDQDCRMECRHIWDEGWIDEENEE